MSGESELTEGRLYRIPDVSTRCPPTAAGWARLGEPRSAGRPPPVSCQGV